MWPSVPKCSRRSVETGRRKIEGRLTLGLIVCFCILQNSGAQTPVQQIQFVPKSYFYHQQDQQQPSSSSPQQTSSDSISSESSIVTSSSALPGTGEFTRNPRHLAPDRYYVGPSDAELDQAAVATTSLRASALDREGNPIDFNQELGQDLKFELSNNNPNNNQYEAKILPNSPLPPPVSPRKTSRGKSRRNKTRPPKNVIIYSLPEQSFYATPNDESSYSEPDSRESSGLRSDLGDTEPQEQVADSKEFRASSSGAGVISQKKALLGQCMAQCIDAIL